MSKNSQPRRGSLQFWPRKKATRLLNSVNWKALSSKNLEKSEKPGFLGFIVYKAGMASCIAKDNTEHSLTKGKKIAIPATILEAPPIKIFSVRFYRHHKPIKDIIVGTDKELKKILRLPKKSEKDKNAEKLLNEMTDYDDIRVIIYSLISKTGIKRTPDLVETALSGKKEEKLEIIKKFLNKEISIKDVAENFSDNLVDVRGVTKGHGFQGPVKRFGIRLRQHKSEKGVRKVGSIGPWHPARLMFTVPMAGQTGFFTRISYNNKILHIGKDSENIQKINPKQGWKHFGKIKTDYIILRGSVPGEKKRVLLLTKTLRPTKKQLKKNYEFLELR